MILLEYNVNLAPLLVREMALAPTGSSLIVKVRCIIIFTTIYDYLEFEKKKLKF